MAKSLFCLLVMNLEGLIQFPLEILAAPLEVEGTNQAGRKSNRRPPKVKQQNRNALNQKTCFF